MSDDTADRGKRLRLRLDELDARRRRYEREEEAEADSTHDAASAEFERTGRLPEDVGEPTGGFFDKVHEFFDGSRDIPRPEEAPDPVIQAAPEPPPPQSSQQRKRLSDEEIHAKLQAVHTEFPGSITDPIAVVGYINMRNFAGEESPFRSPQDMRKFLNGEWRAFWSSSAMLAFVLILTFAAWGRWSWWSGIPIAIAAIWSGFVLIETVRPWLFRADMNFKLKSNRSFLHKLAIAMVGLIVSEGVGLWLHDYVTEEYSWRLWLWRWSLAVEVAIIGAAICTLCLNLLTPKNYTWRQNLVLGASCLMVIVLAWPFMAWGGEHIAAAWSTQYSGAQNAVVGLAYIIAAVLLVFSWWIIYRRADAGQLITIGLPSFIRVWWNRPRPEAKPAPQPSPEPQFSFQTERIIDVKPQRQWRVPNFLFSTSRRHAALIWCGRCAGAVALTLVLSISYGVMRDDGSMPPNMAAYYYAAVAGMILFAVGFMFFWRKSRGRFDAGLTGRAVLQAAIAGAVLYADHFPYQNIIQLVAIYVFVAGCAKFLRLPWAFWRR